ncbi:ribonuclease H-like domain-containing protein [Tanacetum coccineum]
MAGVDVDTLTMKQYLALSRENQAPGVVKPEIRGNVNFKIKSQFMYELREDTFSGNKDEDDHDHIDNFEIKSQFMRELREDTFSGNKDEDAHDHIDRVLSIVCLFNILGVTKDAIMLRGLVLGMRPDEALIAIQTMADHSQKWHDGTTSRNIGSSSSKDGLTALVNKLDNLERDIKKLKESVHAIQVGCQICEGPNLDKDFPLNEEVKQVEEVRYREFRQTAPFNESNRGKFRVGPPGYYTKIDNQQYLTHTDYALWEVIVNGDAPVVASASTEGPIPPKTIEQKPARKNELKAKSTLLLAILDEHLLKFHGIKDGKTLWEAIKARSDGLDKTYDRFQKLISQMEIHDDTSSTNKVVNTAHDVLATSLKRQASSSTYADDVMFSFFVNQSNSLQLDNEDLEQIDTNDLKEIDLKWQVAMLTIRVECYNCHRRGHFVRECRAPRNQGNRNGDAPRSIIPEETHANALVVQDGIGGDDWSYQAEEGPTDFALMAHLSLGSSSSTSSNTEVQNYSKDCLESYQSLQKQFDQQRKVLSKANLEIIAYQLGLESLEARIVLHQKNEAVYEEDIAFLKYDVKVRDNSITELKNQLAEALREKDDLKLKLEKFETSSMKLTKLINSQISVNNKSGVGFNSQIKENELHDCHLNKREVFESASDSSVNEIEEENNQVNDRFKKVEGYHAVPPPYTGNYMPSRPDLSFAGLDDSVYKTNVSETITSMPRNESTASKSSKDSLEQPKDVRPSAPIIEEWESDSDDDCVFRPSIEQNKPSYAKINFVKSDENTRKSVIEQNTYRQAENLRKSQSPRVDKRNWNGLMTQKLGDGFEFSKKACFVCGSLNHLIKDCNFYENKMVGKSVLNNKGRVTGQREVRPVWNNAQRVNHQNKLTHPHTKRNFVPTVVATKSGLVPVNAARQSSLRVATSISIARHVNTVASKPKVNAGSPTKYSYFKAHSPLRRSFNQKSAAKTNNFSKKVYTAKLNKVTTAGPEVVVNTAEGKGKMLLSPQHARFGDQ